MNSAAESFAQEARPVLAESVASQATSRPTGEQLLPPEVVCRCGRRYGRTRMHLSLPAPERVLEHHFSGPPSREICCRRAPDDDFMILFMINTPARRIRIFHADRMEYRREGEVL